MKERVAESLLEATQGGRIPVVCDAASCTEGLEVLLDVTGENRIEVVDVVAFVDQFVLPRLPERSRLDSIVIHPTCSSTRLGLNDSLRRVAAAAAERVIVPDAWGCCGFAGDRGMLHPELTAAATADEAAEVLRVDASAYASVNRTCELGMARATGKSYRHVLEILDEVMGRLE